MERVLLRKKQKALNGSIWINNGTKNSRLRSGLPMPVGWTKGRLLTGNYRAHLHFPNVAGDNNPARIKARLKHGESYLTWDNAWLGQASGIFANARIKSVNIDFQSVQELASYLVSICPSHCPVFGFEFKRIGRGFNPQAPSVDRIKPELGYVKGNIQIISFKANAMKNSASFEELKQFADWIYSLLG